jgi:threonine aldolase
LFYHPLETQENGEIPIDAMEAALYDDHDFQCVPAGLICLEDTHCLCGGTVLSLEYLEQAYEFAQRKGLPIHLDGARLFNAAVAMNVDVRQITWMADSVSLCLSKSLGAPVGSLVAGRATFIHHLRRLRKMIGGGMRQAGIVAAAGIYALEHMVGRLAEDHVHARLLAEGLAQIPGIHVERSPQTNIVFWTLSNPEASLKSFIYALENQGVRVLELGKGRIRAVTHYGITTEEIRFAIEAVRKAVVRSCDASPFHTISQALTSYDSVEYSLACAGAADCVGR